jgi:4-hydroxy-3-methylbut-2-en-1-yl diphosphate synthase IspG/GcpE
MPPAPALAVLVLGCVVGVGQGAANHAGLAVAACGAAFAALWLLLEPGETT